MTQCIKTGGWAYLPEYNCWKYGDIYQMKNGTCFMRVITDFEDNTTYTQPHDDVWVTFEEVGFSRTDGHMKTIIAEKAIVHFEWDLVDGIVQKVAL